MPLTINMKVQQQQDNVKQKEFVNFLLRVGKGEETVHSKIGEDIIRLPDDIVFDNENLKSFISEIFTDIEDNYQDKNYIKNRAILTTKNADVEEINNQVLDLIPGESHEYLSVNSVEDKESVD
jgi:hypothetical protein